MVCRLESQRACQPIHRYSGLPPPRPFPHHSLTRLPLPTWYSRPVLFVADVERSLAFYTEKLGFTEGPRYAEDGHVLLGQVSREDCTVLLNCQQPDKVGRARMFISLEAEDFLALRAEFAQRGAPTREGWWGYDTLIVEDPDGNEWFFPYPDEVVREAVG